MAKVDAVGITKRPKERVMEAIQNAVEVRLNGIHVHSQGEAST